MTPVECGAIILAALIVLAAVEAPACAWLIGRLKRRARRSYTDVTYWQPPLVTQDEIDATWDETALDVWPADTDLAVIEQAIFDRLFRDMPDVAADLREAS